MTEQESVIDPSSLAEELFPSLKGLYIPRTGEIIEWGKGTAIVSQSPLDNAQPLMVISLNGGISEPFEVYNHLGMGPYEEIAAEQQEELIGYFDTNFDQRFSKLFERYPEVKQARQEYRANNLYNTP